MINWLILRLTRERQKRELDEIIYGTGYRKRPESKPERRASGMSVARLIMISIALIVAVAAFAIFTFWLFGSNQPVGAFYLSAKEINR